MLIKHIKKLLFTLLICGTFLINPDIILAATLSFSPTEQSVTVGDTLAATIRINTSGEEVNRVLVKITYPSGLLTPQSLDQSGSFVELWYDTDLTNTPGLITLDGGVSQNAVNGSQLTFAKINFTTVAGGTVNLVYTGESAIYRQSDNSNVLTEAQSVTYTITTLSPTAVPTFGGPTNTPTPTGSPTNTPIPGTVTPTGSITPSPNTLPEGGTVSVTLLSVVMVGIFLSVGVLLLRTT